VYAREIQGKTYTFGVSGKLWANNLVMYDHQTDNLWSQAAGQAITGPLQGTKLTMLPAMQTDWATWKRLHPETLVIEPLKSPYRRNYSVDPYAGYYYSQETGVTGTRREDQRLNPKAFVIGLRLDDQVKAYPFTHLSQEPVVNDTVGNHPVVVVFQAQTATGMVFSRRVGERVLRFTPVPASATERLTMKDAETGSLWSGLDGRALAGPLKGKQLAQISATYAFWFAWKDYYPKTMVYGEERMSRPSAR
jgi:hypothetical protein